MFLTGSTWLIQLQERFCQNKLIHLLTTSPPESLVQIQNNFKGMLPFIPSNRIAQMVPHPPEPSFRNLFIETSPPEQLVQF